MRAMTDEGRRGAFLAVVLIVGGMGSIVIAGGLTLAFVAPELVEATLAGLRGEGPRSGVLLFGIQLLAFFSVTIGLSIWAWRRGHSVRK